MFVDVIPFNDPPPVVPIENAYDDMPPLEDVEVAENNAQPPEEETINDGGVNDASNTLSEVELCTICVSRKLDRLLQCGHPICGICLDHLIGNRSFDATSQQLQPASCPRCREPIRFFIALFLDVPLPMCRVAELGEPLSMYRFPSFNAIQEGADACKLCFNATVNRVPPCGHPICDACVSIVMAERHISPNGERLPPQCPYCSFPFYFLIPLFF